MSLGVLVGHPVGRNAGGRLYSCYGEWNRTAPSTAPGTLSRVIMWRRINADTHSYWPQMLVPSWECTAHVAVSMTEISVKHLVVTGSALDMESFFLWPKLSTPRMTKPALQVSSFFPLLSFFATCTRKRSGLPGDEQVKWSELGTWCGKLGSPELF